MTKFCHTTCPGLPGNGSLQSEFHRNTLAYSIEMRKYSI
jgi:hypothetical protein